MSTTLTHPDKVKREWYQIDASQFTLGRLATRVAMVLMGKNNVNYTPHIDTGNFVVVLNAPKIKLSGRKLYQKEYTRYSRYPGGITRTSMEKMMAEKPDQVIREAVRRMLPKNRLQTPRLRRLRVELTEKSEHKIDKEIK